MHVFIYFFVDLGSILGAFWRHFEVKNRCIFLNDFWTCYFCDSGARRRGSGTSTRLQRDFNRGAYTPEAPQGSALIARKGSYNDPRDALHEI